MSTFSDELVGRTMHDRNSQPVGQVTAIYRYPAEMHAPGAVEVRSGLLRRTYLVDLEDARLVEGALAVPHDRQTIKNAPHVEPLIGNTLSERDALQIREHYWGTPQPA